MTRTQLMVEPTDGLNFSSFQLVSIYFQFSAEHVIRQILHILESVENPQQEAKLHWNPRLDFLSLLFVGQQPFPEKTLSFC